MPGADAAPHETEAGPHVRVDDEVVTIAAVELGHPSLSDRCRGCEVLLCRSDRRGVHGVHESVRDGPGLGRSRTGNDMETDPEPEGAPGGCRQGPHPLDPLSHHRRRLTPGEIHVHVFCRDRFGRG